MNDIPEMPSMTPEWLRRMADLEDQCASVSVGGLARDMGMLRAVPPSDDLGLAALGKLIELARRRLGLRLEELAQQMGIDAYELVRIERGRGLVLEPPQLTQVCLLLGLPRRGVMELAGQIGQKGDRVADAAVRFAFGAESREGLSAEEGRALQEFLDFLAEAPDPE